LNGTNGALYRNKKVWFIFQGVNLLIGHQLWQCGIALTYAGIKSIVPNGKKNPGTGGLVTDYITTSYFRWTQHVCQLPAPLSIIRQSLCGTTGNLDIKFLKYVWKYFEPE
jgi:hypothetical protein